MLNSELKRVRQEAGMTQTALADKLGVAQSYVAKVENAERRLDVIEFIYWLEAAGAFEDGQDILSRVRSATELNS
nr:helix-turn-helix transcriptional regulator [Roseinatronobacter monicus]